MRNLIAANDNKPITYGSVCSGIEAVSIAVDDMNWKPLWFSEIEPFPCAVLAHHWPHVTNLGDMIKIAEQVANDNVPAPDVLVGGTPCQAFSVAGAREGLSDGRGFLTIKFVGLADEIDAKRRSTGDEPCVVWWENVPGVLSSRDNAFGSFLGLLAGENCALLPPGGKWTNAGCVLGPERAVAWRVLDAQYFGLAQRRRRVFVVASAREGFDPSAVLFESEGVRRDTPPSREAWSVVAALTANGVGTCGADDNQGQAGHLIPQVAGTLQANGKAAGSATQQDAESGMLVVHGTQDPDTNTELAHTLGRNQGQENAVLVQLMVESLYSEGITQGEDHACTQEANTGKILRALREEIGEEAFTKWGLGVLDSLQPPQVLQQDMHGCGIRCETGEGEPRVGYCALSCSQISPTRSLCEMREAGRQRRTSHRRQLAEQHSGEFGARLPELSHEGAQSESILQSMWEASEGLWVLRQALSEVQKVWGSSNGEKESAHQRLRVRRLTVTEAERLQGFPDGHTDVPYRGKPAADGPRYKAIGNSMATKVMRWQAIRIERELRKLEVPLHA